MFCRVKSAVCRAVVLFDLLLSARSKVTISAGFLALTGENRCGRQIGTVSIRTTNSVRDDALDLETVPPGCDYDSETQLNAESATRSCAEAPLVFWNRGRGDEKKPREERTSPTATVGGGRSS